MAIPKPCELANAAFRLVARAADGGVDLRLQDQATGFEVANGPYRHMVVEEREHGLVAVEGLQDMALKIERGALVATGRLGPLEVVHRLCLPSDRALLEERITLKNVSARTIALRDVVFGMRRQIADSIGRALEPVAADRFVAVPFRHRAIDPEDHDNDFELAHLLTHTGDEMRVTVLPSGAARFGSVPSAARFSEGWAWTHAGRSIGVFKFNQEVMEFSALAIEPSDDGVWLRLAGAARRSGEPSAWSRIEPGAVVQLGLTRMVSVAGGAERVCREFRDFLDEHGCRFPPDYDPPVHWNVLYDNQESNVGTPGRPPGARLTRWNTYTKAHMLAEAAKARDYGCEALYLDPGWDTDMATLRWGEEWLGPRREFVETLRGAYGLRLALHCPLAPWLSFDRRGVAAWPPESFRVGPDGAVIEDSVCLGSRQYLDEAERRLLEHCSDGVSFLMFDGNWWGGSCWRRDHGHPVPYTLEDHCRASLDLARRVHSRYPAVLIEMHDMIAGGRDVRFTPIYYKYGLPESYDENWGFELMWRPLQDILEGRARSLYYYNQGCNIPLYLHVDLRDDNEHGLALWWYASTCRHLGIGGTHPNPIVADLQRRAMRRYRALDRFYKRGDFVGLSEEVHVHALPAEDAFVMNLFNLSDRPREIGGTVHFESIGLDPHRWYAATYGDPYGQFDPESGTFTVRRRLPPWSADLVEVTAVSESG